MRTMPYADTITAFGLGMLALVALWLVIASIGCTPRAFRLRRLAKGDVAGGLRCGACGYGATALDRVRACPECGAEYARVGLDGTLSRLRHRPPHLVFLMFLIGIGTLIAPELAFRAARLANERLIGSAEIEHWHARTALLPIERFATEGLVPSVAIELERELVGPTSSQGSIANRPAVAGWLTLRITPRIAVDVEHSTWESDALVQSQRHGMWHQSLVTRRSTLGSTAGSTSSHPQAGALPSPWASLHTRTSTVTLAWAVGEQDWTLSGGNVADDVAGNGLNAGLRAAFERAGLDPTPTQSHLIGPGVFESLHDIIARPGASSLDPMHSGGRRMHYHGTLRTIGELVAVPRASLLHPSIPLGVATFLAVPVGIGVAIVVLLWLAIRQSRHARASWRPSASPHVGESG